ncbi:MAG: hypothetical protein GX237_11420 [Clostridiales bacterium]|mgnify:CR=1 FL=1|nr:hypothetical protein [Clostridiales bacterium]
MKKSIAILVCLIILTFHAISKTKNIVLETSQDISRVAGQTNNQQLDYTNAYRILNKPIFNIFSEDSFTNEIEKRNMSIFLRGKR